MLTEYFESPETVERMRASCVGPYLDELTASMARAGYGALTIEEHLRTVVQFARWTQRRRIPVSRWDESLVARFRAYLTRRRVTKARRVAAQLSRLFGLLRARGLVLPTKPPMTAERPAILQSFSAWMLRNRGIASGTVCRYLYALDLFVAELGHDPVAYSVARIRTFVIKQLSHGGRYRAHETVTAIRSFLRFLVAEGHAPAGVDMCVPTVPQWRLSSLPRYLEAPDLARVVNSCDLATGHGMRDYSILLLLSRLGLRAGDVVSMVLGDIDWCRATLRVRGKSHREALLPLPQDVGDALLTYIQRGRPRSSCARVFLTVNAPTRPFASSSSVSDIVRFALRRAGIHNPPSRGAHLLRHSAATAMLRAGGSLETIATVLRHGSPETTAYYAKVDIVMLQEIAQPWPGGAPC